MKTQLTSFMVGAVIFLSAVSAGSLEVHAGEGKNADKLVHKTLKSRTQTFCKQVLPAWIKHTQVQNSAAFKTLVADCYLGHARLAILGVDDVKEHLQDIGLSELPSALLAHEAGMSLDIYRPLAGRKIKDYARSK